MKEEERLKELYAYNILDTHPEKALDEIAEIASAICDTPISLITLLDKDRQWFKSKNGLDLPEIKRDDSFCQYSLLNPKEVLVIEDSSTDARFKDNPLVTGDPNIRFYAGAPLTTPSGHILGNLCIIDNQPRKISEKQKKALQLLAAKAMDYLNTRKVLLEQDNQIESNAQRLQKLTDHLPGAIYQFELSSQGSISMPFVSKGISDLHPSLNPESLKNSLDALYDVMHPEDIPAFQESIINKIANPFNWFKEFRLIAPNGQIHWLVAKSKVEKKGDGTVVWYGILQEITQRKEYINTLEQILFDISHVMRRPAANLKGLVSILEEEELSDQDQKEFIGHIKTVSEELDNYIVKLNQGYSQLQEKVKQTNLEKAIPEE